MVGAEKAGASRDDCSMRWSGVRPRDPSGEGVVGKRMLRSGLDPSGEGVVGERMLRSGLEGPRACRIPAWAEGPGCRCFWI